MQQASSGVAYVMKREDGDCRKEIWNMTATRAIRRAPASAAQVQRGLSYHKGHTSAMATSHWSAKLRRVSPTSWLSGGRSMQPPIDRSAMVWYKTTVGLNRRVPYGFSLHLHTIGAP